MKKADKALILAVVGQFGLKHNWYDFEGGKAKMEGALIKTGLSKTETSKLMKDYIAAVKKKK